MAPAKAATKAAEAHFLGWGTLCLNHRYQHVEALPGMHARTGLVAAQQFEHTRCMDEPYTG